MRIFFLLISCMLSAAAVHATQTCKPDSIPASTSDSQLIDNSDSTITDLKTGLMWKKCLEGVSGDLCETGSPDDFNWQQALQRPETVNSGGGFAGHTDWRLPNIRELISIVEERCFSPAINMNRFPNTSTWYVWSSSPYAEDTHDAWDVHFGNGNSHHSSRGYDRSVRLVRGGQ